MLWTNLWRHLSGEAKLAEIAEEAAFRVRPAVWERVRWQLGTMSPAESRGYVRARSAAVVQREIDRLIRHDASVRPAARARLIALTKENLLGILADQATFAAPLPKQQSRSVVALRRAA
jgi:hypothetical protein